MKEYSRTSYLRKTVRRIRKLSVTSDMDCSLSVELLGELVGLAGAIPSGCSICCASTEGVNVEATETASISAIVMKERMVCFTERTSGETCGGLFLVCGILLCMCNLLLQAVQTMRKPKSRREVDIGREL